MATPKIQYHWKAERVIKYAACRHLCGNYNSLPLETLKVRVAPETALQLAHSSPRPDRVQQEIMKLLGEEHLVLPALTVALLLGNSL